MLNEVINKIKALSNQVDREQKADAVRSAADVTASLAAQKEWKDCVKSFAHKVRSKKDEVHVKVNLNTYKKLRDTKVFKHTLLGNSRLVVSDYVLNQIANEDYREGRRWFDLLPTVMHSNLNTIRRIYPSTIGNPPNIVAEGANKPLREKALITVDFQMQKIAVTDLVTQEALYALPNEEYADYLMRAHLEAVMARLSEELINTLTANGAAFGAGLYSGYTTAAGGQATWNDLIAAMQRDYNFLFTDHFYGYQYGSLLLTSPRVYFGILNDRHSFGDRYLSEEHNVFNPLLDNSRIWWSSNLLPSAGLLLNTDNFELHLLDAVDVYMERVAEAASEQNRYRLVAEVYFALVPRYRTEAAANNWPVLVSANMLNDRNNL